MKRLVLAALLLLAGAAFADDAKFKIGETPFVYTVREGATTYDLVVLDATTSIYQGWTDGPDDRSVILEDFNDNSIMAHGGRHAFLEWGLSEAIRRAQAHISFLKPPLPDPNDKMGSVVWYIRYGLSSNPIVIPPAPLP